MTVHQGNYTSVYTYKVKLHFFSTRPSDRAQIVHTCADRDEIGSQLTNNGPTPPHSDRNPFVSKAVRPTAVRRMQTVCCGQCEAKRRIAALFGEVLLYQHQRIINYDERVHRIKQLTRGNNTIPSHLRRL